MSSLLARGARSAAATVSKDSSSSLATATTSALRYLPLALSGTALALQLVYLVPGALQSQNNASELRLLREELAMTRQILQQQQQQQGLRHGGAEAMAWAPSTHH